MWPTRVRGDILKLSNTPCYYLLCYPLMQLWAQGVSPLLFDDSTLIKMLVHRIELISLNSQSALQT